MSRPWAVLKNPQIHLFLIFVSLFLIIIPVYNKTPDRQVVEQSVRVAAEFFFLVDTEEYAKSWEMCSETLQKMLKKGVWTERIAEIRAYIGPVVERVSQDISYATSSDNVPPGKYVVMTFISTFQFRERVVETLTLLLGDNGEWRVVGYFLR